MEELARARKENMEDPVMSILIHNREICRLTFVATLTWEEG
jgi:hypothetical protein